MIRKKARKMGASETKKPKKVLLKLEFDTTEAKNRLSKAAATDRVRGGANPWAHRILSLVADYTLADLNVDEAYKLALRELAKSEPTRAERIRAAVAKAALDAAKAPRK